MQKKISEELKITYFKNGNLRITPLKKLNLRELVYALNDFSLDIFETNEDGWTYLVSNYKDDVFYLTDYQYNHINTLLKGNSVVIERVPKDHSIAVKRWYKKI